MTASEILAQLKPLGQDSYKNILLKHGAKEPLFGVKIEELKKFQKVIKKDYTLALALFDTGNYDAMYLAGLIADDVKMTKKDLQHWVTTAKCSGISEYTVPWVAAEGLHGRELALEWIDSKSESVASSGWATLSGLVSITDNAKLDLNELKVLLLRVQKTIQQQPDRVRSTMNGFVIAVGSYVEPLATLAAETGKKMGPVLVVKEGTACKVPFAPEQMQKAQKRGSLTKKRKTTKC